MKNIQLISPTTDSEWNAYHRIRESVLWEARGMVGVYDSSHPDEYKENNYPKLLVYETRHIGVVRIDLDTASRTAGFRRVAISTNEQRKGFGKELMKLSEDFALSHGCNHLHANVSPDAIGFYEKIGYELEPNHPMNDPKNPRMKKEISTNKSVDTTRVSARRKSNTPDTLNLNPTFEL